MASKTQKEQERNGPLVFTATFWKRFIVVMSVISSAVGLILSAIAALHPQSGASQRRLLISGIVINALSISLSALTSLDWKKESTHDRAFAVRLMRIAQAHVDSNGQVVIGAKDLKNLSET